MCYLLTSMYAAEKTLSSRSDRFREVTTPSHLVFVLEAAAVIAVLSFVTISFAVRGRIAGDEGFYTLATKLVLYGRRPYVDFFYPQMPYLPYFYAGWAALFGQTWVSMRVAAALVSAGTGFLIWLYARSHYGRQLGVVAAALYCSSFHVLSWYLIVKSYSLSVFLIFAAFLTISFATKKGSSWLFLLAGICGGLSTGTRLLMAPIMVLLTGLIIANGWNRESLRSAFWFCLGGFVALVPVFYFMAINFDAFWFNNYIYHTMRSSASPDEAAEQASHVVGVLLGLIKPSRLYIVSQFVLLLVGSLAAAAWAMRSRKPIDWALLVALLMLVVHTIPVPTYIQYFSTVDPFIICAFIGALALATKRVEARFSPGVARVAIPLMCLAVVGFYISPLARAPTLVLGRTTKTQMLSDGPSKLKPSYFRDLGAMLDAHSTPGSTALVLWSGYIFESRNLLPFPRAENHFGPRVADDISPDARQRYKVMTVDEMRRAISEHAPNYVVFTERQLTLRSARVSMMQLLLSSGYRELGHTGDVFLYG